MSSFSGIADVGACHTYLSGMGVDDVHNTVGENVGAYNTAWVLSCQGGRRVLPGMCTGYGPWYCGLTCVPCLTFSVHFLVLTERASPVGWLQSALIALDGEAVSKGSPHSRSEKRVGVVSGVLARPSSWRLDYSSGLSSRYLGWPMSCALLAMLSVGPSLCWEAGP